MLINPYPARFRLTHDRDNYLCRVSVQIEDRITGERMDWPDHLGVEQVVRRWMEERLSQPVVVAGEVVLRASSYTVEDLAAISRLLNAGYTQKEIAAAVDKLTGS